MPATRPVACITALELRRAGDDGLPRAAMSTENAASRFALARAKSG
jgi:hypothetical protein